MLSQEGEVFFGGAAGGGKSDALLMAALMFAEVPGYAAIIFRRTYPELSLPGGLLDRAADWLGGTDARWNGNTKTWTFPSGSTLSFGHMEHEQDKYNYKSSEFQFCGFDELTSFTETQYLYLFSRLRRPVGSFVPLRMRSASNPGDIGHAFVKRRFVAPLEPCDTRRFIPSRLEDNPYLDEAEYTAALMNLDSFTRNQLLKGSWTDFKGNHFYPAAWPKYRDMGDAWTLRDHPTRTIVLHSAVTVLVGVDIATSEKQTSNHTALVAAALLDDGRLLILDVINERIALENIGRCLDAFCVKWRPTVVAADDDNISRPMLLEYRRWANIPEVRCLPIRGRAKIVRAQHAIISGENKRIYLPDDAHWLDNYCDQLSAFTGIEKAEEDDMVDATGIVCTVANSLKTFGQGDAPVVLSEGREIW